MVDNEESIDGVLKIYRYDGEVVQRVAEIQVDGDDKIEFLSASSAALYFKAQDPKSGSQVIFEYAP